MQAWVWGFGKPPNSHRRRVFPLLIAGGFATVILIITALMATFIIIIISITTTLTISIVIPVTIITILVFAEDFR